MGVAYVIPSLKVSGGKIIYNHVSGFTGELLAILIVMNKIYEMGINKTVWSSLLCMEAQNSETRQDFVLVILLFLYMLQQINRMVHLLWVPAHTGLAGNEEADQLAKQLMTKENIDMQILYSKAEFKSIIKKGINTNWQLFWDNGLNGRYLHSVQPTVGRGRNSRGRRKEDCVLSRLRLGHTGFNSTSHILGKHPTGLCDWCGGSETAERVLIR